MAACWVAGCLFALIDLGRHIMSVSKPPCQNHWAEVAFIACVFVVAVLGAAGKRLAAFLLLAPAIILFLFVLIFVHIGICIKQHRDARNGFRIERLLLKYYDELKEKVFNNRLQTRWQ